MWNLHRSAFQGRVPKANSTKSYAASMAKNMNKLKRTATTPITIGRSFTAAVTPLPNPMIKAQKLIRASWTLDAEPQSVEASPNRHTAMNDPRKDTIVKARARTTFAGLKERLISGVDLSLIDSSHYRR